MKATNLKIGQKYTWRRNSSTIIEVTYLGIDPYTHNFRGHEFSYEKPEGTMYMTLHELQIERDIMEQSKDNSISLNKTESTLLFAVITSNTDVLIKGKKFDAAKKSLIRKGYLRVNEHNIIELNLSDSYFNDRGYTNHGYSKSKKLCLRCF